MLNRVYTIGYSGFSVDAFIAALKEHGISLLVDVRSTPFSKFHPEYNKEALENRLRSQGIHYRNYAAQFGARQTDKSWYSKEGYLDFELFSRAEPFLEGVSKLCSSVEQGYTFALMCAEKDPICCHRTILVARAFFERGYDVIHLLPEGKTVTQQEIQARLMDKYYPDRDQMNLFEMPQDEDALLREAYRKQNAEIGYRSEE